MRRFALFAVGLIVIAIGLVVWKRDAGISAVHGEPSLLETSVATGVWRFLVPSHIRDRANPVAGTADVMKNARHHWADHCAVCHDNDGSGATTVGRRVFPRAPDMRAAGTQRLTDGELFYAIEQGIPWTAMPGWTTGTEEGEKESWGLVRFIRHLPSISADELKEMDGLNPRPPLNDAREREIDDFLNNPPGK